MCGIWIVCGNVRSQLRHKTILQTCDNWDTDYNSYNWEPKFMTIFVTWQSRVTVDSIRNSCDVLIPNCTVPMRFCQWRIVIWVFGTFALILWPSKYFRQIYLSFYPHPNISDRFPSHFIFVGTKWPLINKDFGTFALILWAFKYFRCPCSKNLVKIFVNSYFSD